MQLEVARLVTTNCMRWSPPSLSILQQAYYDVFGKQQKCHKVGKLITVTSRRCGQFGCALNPILKPSPLGNLVQTQWYKNDTNVTKCQFMMSFHGAYMKTLLSDYVGCVESG